MKLHLGCEFRLPQLNLKSCRKWFLVIVNPFQRSHSGLECGEDGGTVGDCIK